MRGRRSTKRIVVCPLAIAIFSLFFKTVTACCQTLTVGNASGTPGDTGKIVPVTLSSEDSIAALSFELKFDSNALTATNADTTGLRISGFENFQFRLRDGEVRVSAIGDFGGDGIPVLPAGSGVILNVSFDVNPSAVSGEYSLTIENPVLSPPGGANSITPEVENGVFEVSAGPSLAPPVNLMAQVNDQQVVLNWSPPSTTSALSMFGNELEVSPFRFRNRRSERRTDYSNTKTSKSRRAGMKLQNSQQLEELSNGVPVTKTIDEDEVHEFFINIPVDSNPTILKFKTDNSTGDPDLFVKFGSPPDLDSFIFDFSSESLGEELIIVTPNSDPPLQPGDWYVSVYGFEASTYTLTATFSQPEELANGMPVTRTISEFDVQEFFINVPPDATSLTVETSNSTGDPDLFVRLGAPPDLDSFIFDFSSENFAPDEELITVTPNSDPPIQAGSWFVSVQEFESGEQSYTLTATYNGGGAENNNPVLSVPTDTLITFGQSLQFTVSATDADSDPISLSVTNLPNGASFGDNGNGTGIFNWTPTANQVGTFQVTFTASDNRGGSDSETIQIMVQDAGGRQILSYNIYRSTLPNARTTGAMIGNVGANTTTFTDSDPRSGISYYQVTAVYNEGESGPSNEVAATVGGGDVVTISGKVIYFSSASKALANVAMNATGGVTTSATTAANGNYSLEVNSGSSFTLTPEFQASESQKQQAISALDATPILQFAANFAPGDIFGGPLVGGRLLAADVTGNGTVSALDATPILQFAAGFAPGDIFPSQLGQVVFDPGSRQYTNVTLDQMNQDYEGVIRGDVTGNFTPTTTTQVAMMSLLGEGGFDSRVMVGKDITKERKDRLMLRGSEIDESERSLKVPVWVEATEGMLAMTLELVYEKESLDCIGIEKEEIVKGFEVVVNDREKGKLRLAMAGSRAAESGKIVELKFSIIDEKKKNSELLERIKVNKVMINESEEVEVALDLFGEQWEEPTLPKGFQLNQNYPNPFNPSTTVTYSVPGLETEAGEKLDVTLVIYNLRGQLVKTLVNEEKSPGFYSVHWDGKDEVGTALASGIYIYRIQVGKFSDVKKMLILK